MTTTIIPMDGTTTAALTTRATTRKSVENGAQFTAGPRHQLSPTRRFDKAGVTPRAESRTIMQHDNVIPFTTAVDNALASAQRSEHGGCASDSHAALGGEATSTSVLAPESYTPLIDEAFWNRLVLRITKDAEFINKVGPDTEPEMAVEFAGRILNQAVGFLKLIADNPGVGFSPSPLVDIGWHNFILYTHEYSKFCRRIAGRFIHHSPFDEVGVDYGSGNSARTVDVLRSSGWPVDDMLWISSILTCDMRLATSKACGACEASRGYDCGSCSTGIHSFPGVDGKLAANNGNCGGQACSDACGGPDGLVSTVTSIPIAANNGNCGGQDSGDACGGGQSGGSDGN